MYTDSWAITSTLMNGQRLESKIIEVLTRTFRKAILGHISPNGP